MAEFSYEDVAAPTPDKPHVTPASLTYDEVIKPPEPAGPMPGPFDALIAGLGAGAGEAEESARVLRGEAPAAPVKPNPAAAPLEWKDLLSPYSQLLPKVAYEVGESSPTIAGGIAGGLAGAATPIPGGTIAGGALGAGVGAAFQSVGPVFGEELRKSPGDPEGAWNKAVERATASGVFSGLGWAAFPIGSAALGPLKQIAFQAFGVQPAIQSAQQVTQNIIQGKPPAEGVGQAYAQGVAGTAIPMLGHAALGKMTTRPTVQAAAGPLDETKLNAAQDKIDTLSDQAKDLQKEMQDAYRDHGPDSPEAAWASHKVAQNWQDIREANAEFTDVITPPKPDPTLWDKLPFFNKLNGMVDAYKRNFQPELVSNLAFDANPIFRQFNGMKAQGRDSIYHRQEQLRYAFAGRPDEYNIDFIKSHTGEQTSPVPEDLKYYSADLENMAKWVNQADRDAGMKFGYVDDYLPREFEKPDAVKTYFNNRVMNLGRANFLKGRTFDFLQQALDAGYKLKTTNPYDLMTNRLISSVEMRAKIGLLNQLSDLGGARLLEHEGQQVNFERAGWQTIKSPTGDLYALHPDLQPMWQNAVDAKGFWQDPGAAGNIFRKWMWTKNHWVPIKLALSAFHLLHVAHIATNDAFARGWSQLKGGDISGAVKSSTQALTSWFYFPEGMKYREAWLTPEWEQTPEQKAMNKLMIDGGYSPQLSEQLRNSGMRNFREAMATHNMFGSIVHGGLAAANAIPNLMFERWIPNLKTAAYVREAQALFERRPDIATDDSLRKAALSTIAKSIDNRFGEMFYSNLFWNRSLKDIGIGSFLSLGWNLGFVREFGGGALEPWLRQAIMTPTQEAVNAAKSKTSFALFYMGTAMALNAAMTKAMTGEDPNGMDYFLPRFGGNNPDGSPRRLSNMFYTREVPMLKKHIDEQYGNPIAGLGEMLWNKMMLEPVHELWNNRDYYGYNITDPASPLYQRSYQMVKYLLSDQFNPISIMGARRALQASGKWDENHPIQSYLGILTQPEGQLSLLGFGPAPSYVAKTPAQNKLAFLFSRYVSPMERPQAERVIMEQRRDARNALEIARQRGDEAGMRAANMRLAQAGVSIKGRKVLPGTADIYEFSRLPFTIQEQFLKEVSPEEFKRYFPKANKQTKANPEIHDLATQYYHAGG